MYFPGICILHMAPILTYVYRDGVGSSFESRSSGLQDGGFRHDRSRLIPRIPCLPQGRDVVDVDAEFHGVKTETLSEQPRGENLMQEVANSGEYHGYAGRISRVNNLLVTDGAPRLDTSRGARVNRRL